MIESRNISARHKGYGDRERGFTLLEVLIAFLILSLTVAGMMQIFSGGFRSTVASETYLAAVSRAESELARIGPEIPLEPGVESGTFEDGQYWHRVIKPYGAGGVSDKRVEAYSVEMTVAESGDPEARSVTLTTLKLRGAL